VLAAGTSLMSNVCAVVTVVWGLLTFGLGILVGAMIQRVCHEAERGE
jgi:hypothetical protein